MFVADHFSGFSTWPSKVPGAGNYTVEHIAWRDGKGDMVADFLESCENLGVEPGVFYSVHDNWAHGVNSWKTADPSKQAAYNAYSQAQLKELLAYRTPVQKKPWFEVWFDAGVDMAVNPGVGDVVQAAAPDAVCHSCYPFSQHKGGAGQGIRWVGNENGVAPEPNWLTADECGVKGSPSSDVFCPASDDTVLSEHYWFWYPGYGDHLKSTKALVNAYLNSVGHGSNLILNIAPRPDGSIAPADIEAYAAMGKAIDCLFATKLANVVAPEFSAGGQSATFPLKLSGITNVSLALWEDLTKGQAITSWSVDLKLDTGAWSANVTSGLTIGHKRLETLVMPQPITVTEMRVNVVNPLAAPRLRKVEVFDWSDKAGCV